MKPHAPYWIEPLRQASNKCFYKTVCYMQAVCNDLEVHIKSMPETNAETHFTLKLRDVPVYDFILPVQPDFQ